MRRSIHMIVEGIVSELSDEQAREILPKMEGRDDLDYTNRLIRNRLRDRLGVEAPRKTKKAPKA